MPWVRRGWCDFWFNNFSLHRKRCTFKNIKKKITGMIDPFNFNWWSKISQWKLSFTQTTFIIFKLESPVSRLPSDFTISLHSLRSKYSAQSEPGWNYTGNVKKWTIISCCSSLLWAQSCIDFDANFHWITKNETRRRLMRVRSRAIFNRDVLIP